MKVKAIKCGFCKGDIVLGQMIADVTFESPEGTKHLPVVHRKKCLELVKKLEDATNELSTAPPIT